MPLTTNLKRFENKTERTVEPAEMLTSKRRARAVLSDSEEDEDQHEYENAYNFLEYEEKATVLRPRPEASKWTRTVTEDIYDHRTKQSSQKSSHSRPQAPTPSLSSRPEIAPKSKKRRRVNNPPGRNLEDSDDSDAPLITRQSVQKPLPTPTTTCTTSVAPTRTSSSARTLTQNQVFVSVDSASEDEQSRGRTSKHNVVIEAKDWPVDIKDEPLSGQALTKTVLFVSASNEDKAPLTVRLSSCRTSNQIFATLITELEILPEHARNVKHISVTYNWSGKRLLIRKGNSDDWYRFFRTVRMAWDSSAKKFDDECEVEMTVHVNV